MTEIYLLCDEKIKEIYVPVCLSHQCFRVIFQAIFNKFQRLNSNKQIIYKNIVEVETFFEKQKYLIKNFQDSEYILCNKHGEIIVYITLKNIVENLCLYIRHTNTVRNREQLEFI